MEFISEDPLIRSLKEYERIVGAALRRTPPEAPDVARDDLVVGAS
jgi:hypothetical protein